MNVFRQLFSIATSIWVIANLSFWLLFVLILAAFKLLFGWWEPARLAINSAIENIYRIAAAIDSFWMLKIVRIRINVDGELPEHPAPIVISNHQTWFDIPVLQHVVTGEGPILKFLIKRQLIWVPIVGWICWALGMPRLNRGQGEGAREKDYAAIESASTTLGKDPGALLIFAEGTRFTPAKQQHQQSPFRHLLNPRPGGFKIAMSAVPPDTPIVSVTIAYQETTNFWSCLGGATRQIDVRLRTTTASEVGDPRDWLNRSWQENDQWLNSTKIS